MCRACRLAVVKKENSERIRAACSRRRQEAVAAVAGKVASLSENVFDEEELEKGLAEAAKEADGLGLEHLRGTEEYAAAAKQLAAEVAEVQQRARVVLAERIRRVLQEPLHEVCRRIMEAKCPTYTSVSAFTRDTKKECSYFVRKHEIGRRLSERMMNQVGGTAGACA